MHLPRRMFRREVERGEVVEVVLDVRSFGQAEAHLGEDRDHLVHHLHDRVHATGPARRRRAEERSSAPAASSASSFAAASSYITSRGDGGGDAVAQAVDQRTLNASLIRATCRPGTSADRGDRARLAEKASTRRASERGQGLRRFAVTRELMFASASIDFEIAHAALRPLRLAQEGARHLPRKRDGGGGSDFA